MESVALGTDAADRESAARGLVGSAEVLGGVSVAELARRRQAERGEEEDVCS